MHLALQLIYSLSLNIQIMEQPRSQSQDQHSLNNSQISYQFDQLLKKHSPHSLVMIGPKFTFFPGKIAFEFYPLSNNAHKDRLKLQGGSSENQPTKIALKNEKRDIIESSFQRDINTRPNLPFNGVIQIDDSSDDPEKEGVQQTEVQIKKPIIKFRQPVFVYDRKQYTPTFAIQSTALTDNEYRNQFSNKIREYRRQVSRDNMMQPRPRTKYLYCAICKSNYEEYLGHVITKKHIQNYQKCKYTRYLTSLELALNTGTFKKEREREVQKKQEQKIRKRYRKKSNKDGSIEITKQNTGLESDETSSESQNSQIVAKKYKNKNKHLKKQAESESSQTSRDRSKKSLRRSREQKNAPKKEKKEKKRRCKSKFEQSNYVKLKHQ